MKERINRHTNIRVITALFACILSASCAPSLKGVLSRYNEAPISCRSYQEFDYEKLDMPCSKSFWIDENSKAFAFDTGKSYFKAFELPGNARPYSIIIRSYQMHAFFGDSYIFSPAILFLDGRFGPKGPTVTKAFNYTGTSFFDLTVLTVGGDMQALEAEIKLTGESADYKYMVIFTTDEQRKERTVRTIPSSVPLILPGLVTVIPTGGIHTDFIPHSPIGKLKVIVREKSGD